MAVKRRGAFKYLGVAGTRGHEASISSGGSHSSAAPDVGCNSLDHLLGRSVLQCQTASRQHERGDAGDDEGTARRSAYSLTGSVVASAGCLPNTMNRKTQKTAKIAGGIKKPFQLWRWAFK